MQLECINVTAGYGKSDILHGVNLKIEQGEFVGLVGPNGCGKSTLLRALSRTLPLRSGDVNLDAISIWSMRPMDLALQLAFVPQQEPADFDFTVQDVVMMGRYPHQAKSKADRNTSANRDYDAVNKAMEVADIAELADRPITQLSGGEHRRVLLARALAQEAPLLLLDEPTAHLDVTHQAEMLNAVRGLVRTTGVAALAALHELNSAAEYCDRLVLMHEGKIVESGTPEQVLTSENLSKVYGADAAVGSNPITGRPMILSITSGRRLSANVQIKQ